MLSGLGTVCLGTKWPDLPLGGHGRAPGLLSGEPVKSPPQVYTVVEAAMCFRGGEVIVVVKWGQRHRPGVRSDRTMCVRVLAPPRPSVKDTPFLLLLPSVHTISNVSSDLNFWCSHFSNNEHERCSRSRSPVSLPRVSPVCPDAPTYRGQQDAGLRHVPGPCCQSRAQGGICPWVLRSRCS